MTNHPNRNVRGIIETGSDGLPWGSYQVEYYVARKAGVAPLAGQDSDVSAGYVERLRGSLGRMEIAVARCRNQPGGAVVFGSSAARDAWHRGNAAAAAE